MSDAIHPLSRKSKQIQRQTTRQIRVNHVKLERKQTCVVPAVEKMKWFKDYCQDLNKVTEDEAKIIAKKYISRNEEEINQINENEKKNTKSTKSFWKTNNIVDSFKSESAAFESGIFEIPEITSKKVLQRLQAWDGINSKSMELIKVRKIKGNVIVEGDVDIEMPNSENFQFPPISSAGSSITITELKKDE